MRLDMSISGVRIDVETSARFSVSLQEEPRYHDNLHTSQEIADRAGFRAPLVEGRQILSLISGLLERELGERWTAHGALDARFLRPVFCGDSIDAGVRAVTVEGDVLVAEGWARVSGAGEHAVIVTLRIPLT